MSTITRGFTPNGDRYVFDHKLCTAAKGWAQFDTSQDAWYYGNWVNPITLQIVSHVEGDQTHIQYDDEAEFISGLAEMIRWYTEHGYNPKIDGMCNDAIIEALTRLGFAEHLH
jgi:hypothetical protein